MRQERMDLQKLMFGRSVAGLEYGRELILIRTQVLVIRGSGAGYSDWYGGIAQLARAFGSYPECHWFKSSCRYQWRWGYTLRRRFGPLVKWLRHRPFTAVTRVRVSYGSP